MSPGNQKAVKDDGDGERLIALNGLNGGGYLMIRMCPNCLYVSVLIFKSTQMTHIAIPIAFSGT